MTCQLLTVTSHTLNMFLFRAMQIFIKHANHACINEHVFENLYGETPHRDETKWNRDEVLNRQHFYERGFP